MRLRVAVWLALVLAGTQVRAQSLADMARQKPADKKAKRVITDDDLPPRPPEAAAPAANADSGSASSSAVGSKDDASGAAVKPAADPDKPSDKSADASGDAPAPDSQEVKEAKERVKAKTIQIDALNAEIKDRQEQIANTTDSDKVESLAKEIKDLQHYVGVWMESRQKAQDTIDQANKKKSGEQEKPQP